MTATAAGLAARVDDLFRPWKTSDAPGAAVGVLMEGELVVERYFGMGDLEQGIPLSASSVFDIASTSKQFTAACALLLHDRGEIDLDDPVQAYIPELPEYETPITVRHLVHHTSGIRDYIALRVLAGVHDSDHIDLAGVLEIVCRQRGINFAPGTEHSYCNSGYVLLGIIVSRVTGMSLNAWATANIFEPLGMSRTHFNEDCTILVPGLVQGYRRNDAGDFRKAFAADDVCGDGGLHTTLRDLGRWELNYFEERVGGPGFFERMATPGTPDNAEAQYGFGLSSGEYRGARIVSHGGNLLGYSGEYMRFPQHGLTVICLANLAAFDAPGLCRRIADAALEGRLEGVSPTPHLSKATAPSPGPAVDPETLRSYAGLYRQKETGLVVEVAVDEQGLFATLMDKRVAFEPGSEAGVFGAEFQDLALDVGFEENAEGVAEMVFRHEGEALLTASWIATPDVGAIDMGAYVGRFYSAELEIFATAWLEGGRLCLRRGSAPRDILRATLSDEFALLFGGVKFVREGATVSGFELSMSRTWGVGFSRVEDRGQGS